MMEWEVAEFEEKLSQGVKIAQNLILNPDDCANWKMLEAWANDNKSFVNNDSYEAPEETGYDVTKVDEGYEDKSYGIERLDFKEESLGF